MLNTWWIYRCSKCSLNIPSVAQSTSNYIIFNFKLPLPFRHCHSNTIDSHEPSPHHMSHLFSLSAPSTILRRIVSVGINTVKRMLGGRLFTHIFEKIRKTPPVVADFNSPSSVSVICPIFRIMASFHHRSPRIIFKAILASSTSMFVSRMLFALSMIHKITTHIKYYNVLNDIGQGKPMDDLR